MRPLLDGKKHMSVSACPSSSTRWAALRHRHRRVRDIPRHAEQVRLRKLGSGRGWIVPSVITVNLPKYLNLSALAKLARRWPTGAGDITLRLHSDQWVRPAGLAGLACLVERSRIQGSRTYVDHGDCANAGYWERMGFFDVLGLQGPGIGPRTAPEGRFCELRRISDIEEVDEITEALVDVTDPSAVARRIYGHVVSEALNNVCQHSGSHGFCHAQFNPHEGLVRFCIADYGCGLRHALRGFGPKDDSEAIAKALEVGVTSGNTRMGTPEMRNRGVGLSAAHRLVVENEGELVIWSGTGVHPERRLLGRGEVPSWQGTLVAAKIRRNGFARTFQDVMRELEGELREREQPHRMTRLP